MAKRRSNQRRTGLLIACGLGLLLAFAGTFFLFAMPRLLLESLVGATGIAAFLPQAASPLGQTARFLVAGAGGLLLGSSATAILMILDRRFPGRRSGVARPFHAVEELGNPPAVAIDEAEYQRMLDRNLRPRFSVEPIDLDVFALDIQPEPNDDVPHFRRRADDQDGDVRLRPRDVGTADDAIMLDPEEPLDLGDWPTADELVDAEIEFTSFEPLLGDEAEARNDVPAEREQPAPLIRIDEPLAEPVRAPLRADSSISDLLGRLEAGLASRSTPNPLGAPDRSQVRSALDELRKLANPR